MLRDVHHASMTPNKWPADCKIHNYTEPSDAIPAERRIPKEQGGDITYYIAQCRAKASEDGSHTPIVEYNPSLVPLIEGNQFSQTHR